MYDVAIIGGGPAGFSSALTSTKRNLKVCMIYPKNNDSWLTKIDVIDNYPGLINVSGREILDLFVKQANLMNIKLVNGVVTGIINNNSDFYINLGSEFIQTKKIILAIGMKQTNLLPKENDYLGKGISYCATCDGMLYKNKQIGIIDESNDLEEITFLASLASKVYLFTKFKYPNLSSNVIIIEDKVVSLEGSNKLETIATPYNTYNVEGLFIFRNTMPLTNLLPELKLNNKFIVVDKNMATNIPNVYACGDCIGTPFQVAKAVGEGNIAAISASKE